MKKKPATKKKVKGNKTAHGKKPGKKKSDKKKAKKQAGKQGRERGTLTVERQESVDLHEVSGICLSRGSKEQMWLMAIGDRHARLARVRLNRKQTQKLEWEYLDIAALPGSKIPASDPQIEAICTDGTGRVLLLQEWPARAELVDLHGGDATVVASFELSVGEDFRKVAKEWNSDGSCGEGAVLLPNGHLLVAKEKKPAALIEFGPPGEAPLGVTKGGLLHNGVRWEVTTGDHEYVALAVWEPDGLLADACEDFSDLETGPDGNLYLLSDKSRTVARIDTLSPDSDEASCVAVWELDGVDGKPEGLAFTPKGQAIIALDQKETAGNLVLMTPAIAARSRK
ncbi:hypothetical protein DES53_103121 [Roseimicrobium gellanilyticum]|uniref:Phytase-like protein with esterase activity n=1 Tax=Roseimicrobium gellanilyticum TaxID=748857 RepID=A0A366HPT5_9BACT|nr:hypothetical protein [Roseimicrobium gellanilyticum]RBP45124.1 hypothetical protein DES53_103121 [Roseimicrobium gellanilyticum]